MAADPALIEHLSDVWRTLGHVTARRMFSGAGVYVDGLIISIVRGDGSVYLKVDAETRGIFEAAGSSPFTYERKTGSKSLHSYWLLPADPFDDPDAVLDVWAAGPRRLTPRARKSEQSETCTETPVLK